MSIIKDIIQRNIKTNSNGRITAINAPQVEKEILEYFIKELVDVGRTKKDCPTCKGAGVIWSEKWQVFHKRYPANSEVWNQGTWRIKAFQFFNVHNEKDLPPEEPDCTHCEGQGWLYSTAEDLINKYKKQKEEK